MKTSLFIAFFLIAVFPSGLLSQDLYIYYDTETKLIRYVKDGNEITRPSVRKGDKIYLKLENYNNYLYNVEITSKSQVEKIPAGSSPPGLNKLINLGQNSIQPLDLLSTLLPGGAFGGGRSADDETEGFILAEAIAEEEVAKEELLTEEIQLAEFEKIKSKIDLYAERLENSAAQLQEIQLELKAIYQQQKIKSFALSEIENLKKNQRLSAGQIKKLAKEYFEKALNVEASEELDLSKLFDMADAQEEFQLLMLAFNKKREMYNSQLSDLYSAIILLDNFNFTLPGIGKYQGTVQQLYDGSEGNVPKLKEAEEKLSKLLPEIENNDLQSMAALLYQYEELKANTFSHTHLTIADGDMVSFDINFAKIDSSGNATDQEIDVPTLDIPVYGGFKLNASLGISFGQFFDPPQNYFLRDSTILAGSQGNFTPMITSYFHFYSQSPSSISIGGSFGLGFPIGSGESLESISFFLGPSLVFGRKERIVFSGGLLGGKVDRLDEG